MRATNCNVPVLPRAHTQQEAHHIGLLLAPDLLLRDIFNFLGVDSDFQTQAELTSRKINANIYPEIPQQIEKILASHLIQDMDQLHKLLPNSYTLKWLERARALV